jgi:hypothetical protein
MGTRPPLLCYSFLFCSIGRKQQATRMLLRLAVSKLTGDRHVTNLTTLRLATYCTCLPPTQAPLANNKLRSWKDGIRGCYGTCLL